MFDLLLDGVFVCWCCVLLFLSEFSDKNKNHDTKPNQQERHYITKHKSTEQHQIIQEHMTNNTREHSKISKTGSWNKPKESRTHATTHNKEQDHRTTSRTRATFKHKGQTRIQNTNNNKEETANPTIVNTPNNKFTDGQKRWQRRPWRTMNNRQTNKQLTRSRTNHHKWTRRNNYARAKNNGNNQSQMTADDIKHKKPERKQKRKQQTNTHQHYKT